MERSGLVRGTCACVFVCEEAAIIIMRKERTGVHRRQRHPGFQT